MECWARASLEVCDPHRRGWRGRWARRSSFETLAWAEELLEDVAASATSRLPVCTRRLVTPASSGGPEAARLKRGPSGRVWTQDRLPL